MKGINDGEIFDLLDIGRKDAVDIRFIEIMPIGFGKQFTGMDSDEIMSLLREKYPGIKKEEQVRGNGPARYLKIPGFCGVVGFIDAVHCKFCGKCNRIRLTSEGFLKPCLYYSRGIPLREKLRSGISREELSQLICQTVLDKPEGHRFSERDPNGEADSRKMSQIGG